MSWLSGTRGFQGLRATVILSVKVLPVPVALCLVGGGRQWRREICEIQMTLAHSLPPLRGGLVHMLGMLGPWSKAVLGV